MLDEFDLSETYFPYAEGYQWIYERNLFIRSKYGDEDEYDTISIKVEAATLGTERSVFHLSKDYSDIGKSFFIVNDSIEIIWGESETRQIHVYDESDKYYGEDGSITYSNDSLIIDHYEYRESWGYYGYYLCRLKEVGVLSDYNSFWTGGTYEEGVKLRLLYFIKGTDTVWSAD